MRESYRDEPRDIERIKAQAAKRGITLGKGWLTSDQDINHIAVDRDSFDSFLFFLRYSDLWRYSAAGTLLGIDVVAMTTVIKLEKKGRKSRKRLLDDVIDIASGVKKCVVEKSK